MSGGAKLGRRCFLRVGATAGAGLAIAFHLPGYVPPVLRASTHPAKGFAPNAFLHIDQSSRVTIQVPKSEMGQGVRTALPMILADELEADWALVEIIQASPGPGFKSLNTGGSWSVGGSWKPLRQAGATARELLLSAAANIWQVERTSCRAENGAVIHATTGRRLPFGALVAEAAKLPIPTDVPLKHPKDFKIIGQRRQRLDGPRIVSGVAIYGIDVHVPGMRYATIVRAPFLGGKVASWDATAAKNIAGVRAVVAVSTGLAVVADNSWAALKGREALKINWGAEANSDFNSQVFWQRAEAALKLGGHITRQEGQGLEALTKSARKLEAVYAYPFQAHATVEPANCVADVRDNACEIWAPTQAPDTIRADVAKLLGLKPETVKVNVTLLGGGFGRRLGVDYAMEAAELSKAVREPVQVLWTRQDDMQNGYFQPASLHRMEAGFDAKGQPVVWTHKKAGFPFMVIGPPPEPKELETAAFYQDSSWGAYDVPYAFPAIETSYVSVASPVPAGPWRAVYSPSCTFARECFFDELAHAAKQDPLGLRLDLLRQPRVVKAGNLTLDRSRLSNVLKLVAAKAGWGKQLPAGRGQGLACNIYDGETCIAYVAEVSVEQSGRLQVRRVVCAVDCGLVINPNGVEAQIEGGIIFGLSTVLHGQITFRAGRVEQSSYRDYPVMRMQDTPLIEIHIVPSTESPTGMGEPPVPPIAPAVLNAVFAATGKRIRRLPVRPEDLAA